ncbi:uncharacterized protein LOC127798384 [Diospyros lotus]|uniref:uncharacterized protein LOC127798384 n=1 Tax=Diospyros lotus TaxID=55363 RepID=UPI00224E1D08|nr:uncharacterized protein LOC127798384 [Diospyros lotus]
MMGAFIEEDKECRFFDARGTIKSIADHLDSSSSSFVDRNSIPSCFDYDVWTRSPQSVQERRSKFLDSIGLKLNLDRMVLEKLGGECRLLTGEIDRRVGEISRAVLRTPTSEEEFYSTRPSMSSWSNDASDVPEDSGSNICRIGNLGGGIECCLDQLRKESNQNNVFGLDQLVMPQEFESTSSSAPMLQQSREREIEGANNLAGAKNRVKSRWLRRLFSFTCMADMQGVPSKPRSPYSYHVRGARVQRVKVRHFRKRWKELSALFSGQDIPAHEGPILTMRFSLDGQHLASAGEDGILRVWKVGEDARSNEIDIPDIDPSCIYFTVNHLSKLTPFILEKEKLGKLKSLGKTADSACVIFPPKIFRILEEPVHQFSGHKGDILEVSWSTNNYLLSSSVDKTVRLWQVGCEHCLKVFSHSNYVTSVQFNPVNNDQFISGSIDGKVRIWEIAGCQVIDWIELRDIVTAVCYRPGGQGVVVGSMAGTCWFYDRSDGYFRLEAEIDLHSKKKATSKSITGFQFFPLDPSKLMVTSAGLQLRILHGTNIVGKYRGLRNTGNQLSAFFTSNGKHIVSTCKDSNVYIWNCINHEQPFLSRPKILRSWERFFADASIAIPWPGLNETSPNELPSSSSPACFSLSQEFILESFPKGSATWPEEELLGPTARAGPSAMHKSHYKFLRACQSTSSSHAWNLVIVTAGRDGRIRSFHNYGLPVAL